MSESNTPTPPVEPTPPGYDAPTQASGPASGGQPPAAEAPYQQPVQPQSDNPLAYPQAPYQQAPYQQQGMSDPASTVTLNYWLSVFFSWIPALIFFFTEKGKNGFTDEFNKSNLNFSIIRGIVGVLTFIPYLGFVFGALGLAMFIIHIIAAVEAPKKYRNGEVYKFPFNVALIK